MAQSDPLPSWQAGAAKKSITDFVARVVTPGAELHSEVPGDASGLPVSGGGQPECAGINYTSLQAKEVLKRLETLSPPRN
jgi:hypothetical protein